MNYQIRFFCIHLIITVGFIGFQLTNSWAGTTGKIAGKIVDNDTGEGLPGANVVIDGTPHGAAADLNGNFSIINIPPRIYSVKISMMGYTTVVLENVRVSVDMTTTINVRLSMTVIESAEVVLVTATRPLVQMDMTASFSSVGAKEIENLPVQEVNDVLQLQAGIIKEGTDLHIRGGRAGEIAYWIDGVATTDVYNGKSGIAVENSAIQELLLVSGTFNAEYGQAMSGIINILTKEGDPKYTGRMRIYLGDYITGNDHFSVLKKVTTVENHETGKQRHVGESGDPLRALNPTLNLDASLSGPVPFSKDKMTFFTNARAFSQEGYLYGRRWFKPQGIPGDSALVPLDPLNRYSLQGKLTWRPSGNFKVSYNYFWNQVQKERQFNQLYKYNPDGMPLNYRHSSTHIFSLNHTLSSKTFYELRLNHFKTHHESYVYKNPLEAPNYLVFVPGDSSTPAYSFDPELEPGRLDSLKYADANFRYLIDPARAEGYVHPDSARAPSGYSFLKGGMDYNHCYRSTQYSVVKFDITSQVTNNHQIKGGLEYRSYELWFDEFDIRKKREGDAEVIPFQPSVESTATIFHDTYTRDPVEFSAYVQDKIEFQHIIMNIGVRFDYFNSNSVVMADPEDPNIFDPFKYEHQYKNWVAPLPGLSQREFEEYLAKFQEYTPDERREFMHQAAQSKYQISPRLGIAYPISDHGAIHFSYGHFFQIPEFQYLYASPDFKFTKTGGKGIVGNADLNPQRTTQYEIGLQQQLAQNLGIDVTLFYRDVRDWVGTSPLIETALPNVTYSIYENKDYSNVRGATLKLERRYTNNIAARLDYTFQIAEGTYSSPDEAFFVQESGGEPRKQLLPLNWDQRHTLNGSLSFSKNGYVFALIARYWTGKPYTPSFPRAVFVGEAATSGLVKNSARLPHQNTIDLLISRRFRFHSWFMTVFMNIYNVFDQIYPSSVYTDTGSAEYTTFITPELVPYDARRIGTINDYVNQPGWWTAPRQLQIGISIGFE